MGTTVVGIFFACVGLLFGCFVFALLWPPGDE